MPVQIRHKDGSSARYCNEPMINGSITTEEKKQIMARYNALPQHIKNHIALVRTVQNIEKYEDICRQEKSIKNPLKTMILNMGYRDFEETLDLIEIARTI